MKTCVILAQIKSVDSSIYYLCCRTCLSKVNFCKKTYICKKCNHEIHNPSPQYKLSLEIFDGCALTRVTIFGKVLNKFIGTNVDQFLRWKKISLVEYNINEQQLNEIFKQNLKKYFLGEWFYFKFNLKNIHYTNFNMKDIKSSMNIMNLKMLLIIHQEFKSLNVVNLFKTAKLGTFTTIIQKTNLILKKRKQRRWQSFSKNSINVKTLNLSTSSKKSIKANDKSNYPISSTLISASRSQKKCKRRLNNKTDFESSMAFNSSNNESTNSEAKSNFTDLMMNLFKQQSIPDKNYTPSINFSVTENISKSIDNIQGSNDSMGNKIFSLNTVIGTGASHNGLNPILFKFPKNISMIDCVNSEFNRVDNKNLKDITTVIDGSILNQSQDLFSPNHGLDKRKSFVSSTPMMLINKLRSFTDNKKMQSPILSNSSICTTLCIDSSINNLPSHSILADKKGFVFDGHYNINEKGQHILSEDYFKNNLPMISSNKKCCIFKNDHNALISQPISFNFSKLFANESKSLFESNYNQSNDLFE